ncbi:MAG: hypothetical protein WB462_18005 [Solirubrobacterales bacterium]
MERLRGRKPSPAMVVSIIALVFALAGSAAAGVATISALSKKEKKQTRNIADSEVNKLAPGLSVKSAGALASGGLKQSAFKLSVVVTLDYPSIPAQSCETLDSDTEPGLGALAGVAGTDAIIATPNQLKMPQVTFVAGNLTPGVYFDACNPTAAPIDPQPFMVRVNTIGA